MKKVIIGVHGLGNKPPKYLLQKWWKDAILEGFKLNGINKILPDFEMVYWADILYPKPLNKWEKNPENPYYLHEPYSASLNVISKENNSFQKKIVDFLSEQLNKIFLNDDKTLNYSFITDAIIKKYFRELEIYYTEVCKDENDNSCKVRDLIRERVTDILNKYKNHEIVILSHSMGTIVAFDVLMFLLPELKVHSFVTIGSPLGLPVVVSKIAAEQKRSNGMKLMVTPPGVLYNWFNVADIRDHVALNYKLADDFTANEYGVLPKDFLVNNDYQINGEENPHKSFGYLRTKVISEILDDFIGDLKQNLGQHILNRANRIIEAAKQQFMR